MSLRPLGALVRKDLLIFATDWHSVLLAFVAPIALASFMATIFGGAGPSTPGRVAITLSDEDGGPVTAAIVAAAQAEPRLDVRVVSTDAARAAVRQGQAAAAVVLPAGFGPAATAALYGDATPPELLLVHDPTRGSEISLLRGLLTRLVLESVASDALGPASGPDPDAELLAALGTDLETPPADAGSPAPASDAAVERAEFLALFEGLDDDAMAPEDAADRAALVEAFPGLRDLIEPEPAPARMLAAIEPDQAAPAPLDRSGLNPTKPRKAGLTLPYTSRDESITGGGEQGEQAALAGHAFAGMVVQFILFSAVEWGVGLLNERRRGLWKRLRAAPVSRLTLMAGKALSCTLVSLLIATVVFGFGGLVFGIRIRGDAVAFGLLLSAFALMASQFGLLVAAIGRTPQGARSVAILGVLVLVMLGGGWMPSFLFPDWLNAVTPLIPTRWAIDGFDGLLGRGWTLTETAPAIGVLLGFATGFGVLALGSFRWAEG